MHSLGSPYSGHQKLMSGRWTVLTVHVPYNHFSTKLMPGIGTVMSGTWTVMFGIRTVMSGIWIVDNFVIHEFRDRFHL